MTAKKTTRREPWHERLSTPVKALGGIVVALGLILTAFITVDERYAHAGDMRQLSLEMSIQSQEARRNYLDDKVFDLSQKRKNAADAASLNRYTGELRDVKRDIAEKRKLLDTMKAGK